MRANLAAAPLAATLPAAACLLPMLLCACRATGRGECATDCGEAGASPLELGVPASKGGAADARLVQVEAALVRLPRPRADLLLGPPTVPGRGAWVAERTGALLDELRVELERGAQWASFPILVVRSGEVGSYSVVNQQAYVSGFEVELAGDAALADPTIDVLQQGLVLELEPRLTVNGEGVRLCLELARTELLLPIEERQGPVGVRGSASSVTVGMPVLETRNVELERVVRAGNTLVLCLPSLSGEDEVDLCVLRPARAEAPSTNSGARRAAP